jgi:thymidine kinase
VGADAGARGEGEEFCGGEGGVDADDAVVDGDGVPAGEPAGGREEAAGERVAVEVDGEDGVAGGFFEVGEDAADGVVFEVMQEQAADDEVDAFRADGPGEDVGCDAGAGGGAEVAFGAVEGDETGAGKAGGEPAEGGAVGGADVEDERIGTAGEVGGEEGGESAVAAEPAVDAIEVAQIRGQVGGRGIVHQFRLDSACHDKEIMDIVTGNIGWIEVVCGPMFSGKSEELIRRLRRAKIARKRVQVFKPVLDDRYSADEIVSHSDARMPSQVIKDAKEVLGLLDWRTQVIGFDEANFLGPNLVEIAQQLADSGKQVLIAGLDTDYLGRPFPPIPELLSLAESITKTLAICMRCGNPAKHTQRLVESEDLIVVGAAGMYEARCRRCFEPGIPKQEILEFARPTRERQTS